MGNTTNEDRLAHLRAAAQSVARLDRDAAEARRARDKLIRRYSALKRGPSQEAIAGAGSVSDSYVRRLLRGQR